jgi:hypothetical protein
MAAEPTAVGRRRINAGKWLTGAGAGAIGAALAWVLLIAMGETALSDISVESLGVLLMPGAVFGLVYAGFASLDRVSALATEPRTGAVLGLGYGLLFWVTTIIGSAISPSGLLVGVTFGTSIGLLYAVSPYVE